MSLLFYKRPDYVAKITGPMEASNYQQYLEKTRRSIPTELGFEYVVSNRAMPVGIHYPWYQNIPLTTI